MWAFAILSESCFQLGKELEFMNNLIKEETTKWLHLLVTLEEEMTEEFSLIY